MQSALQMPEAWHKDGMRYPKHELIEKLGEPAEENVRPHQSEPGKPMSVLRWDCGCGALKLADEQLWEWDPSDCARHKAPAKT
jgi:hypothetical protein